MCRFIRASLGSATSVISALTVVAVVSNASAGDMTTVGQIAPSAAAAADRPHLRQVSAEALKHKYLQCDRAATQAVLDMATAGECSMVHEELQERVFSGSFEALLAWWRGARDGNALKSAPAR